MPPARLGPMDFIGKVENIENDFSIVCRALGIENTVLPILNTTTHRPYRSYYSDALKQEIEEFCKPEIEMFRYTF